jgi:hypothetical protein
MSSDEISNVIKTQIMPNAPQANVAPVAGSTKVADVLQRSIFGPIDAIMPGSNLANEPTPSIGSLAKGIKSLSNVPTQWQLSSQLELIEANKRKYGQNFENAPEKEKADILNTVKKASENLSYLAQSGEDVKAIEQKYGKDPLSKKIDALEQKPDFKNATDYINKLSTPCSPDDLTSGPKAYPDLLIIGNEISDIKNLDIRIYIKKIRRNYH